LLAAQGVVVQSDCGGAGTCGKCRVNVEDEEGRRNVLACQFVPTAPVAVTVDDVRPVRPVRRVRLHRTKRQATSALRLAVDVGTTTVSLAAIDLGTGRVARRADVLNPQMAFGADVMSRIVHERRVRRAGLEDIITGFAQAAGVGLTRPTVAVGNTVMAHFLFGRSPASLGMAPYKSRLPLKRTMRCSRHGLRMVMPPLLGSFVGSDCTSAILASGMHRSPRLSLLVDAGTNGEVVLGNRERLLVASTAAGPAFEGATLECGSLARRGAVRHAKHVQGGFRLETVGNVEPTGICGSGVLDVVAEGLKVGLLDRTGRVTDGTKRIALGESVYLSQADLREVQLAKGAIAAAVRILLSEWGAQPADIEMLYVTGKFGAALWPESAAAIGLLPLACGLGHDPKRRTFRSCPARVRQHGNLALLGALRMARDSKLLSEAERIAACSREVGLSGRADFERVFVDSLNLEPWT
jgi:uncharacterized 2Fe-2S/4Fe-4S cluster protein (DUF4445 family)